MPALRANKIMARATDVQRVKCDAALGSDFLIEDRRSWPFPAWALLTVRSMRCAWLHNDDSIRCRSCITEQASSTRYNMLTTGSICLSWRAVGNQRVKPQEVWDQTLQTQQAHPRKPLSIVTGTRPSGSSLLGAAMAASGRRPLGCCKQRPTDYPQKLRAGSTRRHRIRKDECATVEYSAEAGLSICAVAGKQRPVSSERRRDRASFRNQVQVVPGTGTVRKTDELLRVWVKGGRTKNCPPPLLRRL